MTMDVAFAATGANLRYVRVSTLHQSLDQQAGAKQGGSLVRPHL